MTTGTTPDISIENASASQARSVLSVEQASLSSFVQLDVDQAALRKIDTLRGGPFKDEKAPELDPLSCDMPEDESVRASLNNEIRTNQQMQDRNSTHTNILSASLGKIFSSKKGMAMTNLSKVHGNNVKAVMFANALNNATQRFKYADAHFSAQLQKAGISPSNSDEIKRKAESDSKFKESMKMAEAAQADLYTQLAKPENQLALKELQDTNMIGRESKAALERSVETAAETLSGDSTTKESMEKLSEKFGAIMESFQEFIDGLLNGLRPSMRPS
ncbi:hypothetical protein [Alteromonas antoniana]|uniref:hypothetical protein n=1 Tax=Alteromonas antoniana TaxID=2803813 RepID=UPI001C44D4FC|nr:hypothetical protein [Alteromonas antoniana]